MIIIIILAGPGDDSRWRIVSRKRACTGDAACQGGDAQRW